MKAQASQGYYAALRIKVLQKLLKWEHWGQGLTQSDLEGMLEVFEPLTEALKRLKTDGYVELTTIGDEPVVWLTPAGREAAIAAALAPAAASDQAEEALVPEGPSPSGQTP